MSACAILVILAELADCVDLSDLAVSVALVGLVDFVDLGGSADSSYLVDMSNLLTLRRPWDGRCGDLAGRFS